MPSPYDVVAKNVITSTLGVKPGDNVIVETWDHGLPLARAFVFNLRELGARPLLFFEDEDTFWRCCDNLGSEKLGKVGEHEWAALEKTSSYIFIPGPADFRRMLKDRPKYLAAAAYNSEWYERAERHRLKGARLAFGYASAEQARVYKLPFQSWQRMLLAASSIDFSTLKNTIDKIRPLLQGKGQIRITAPNGTDLSLRLAGRDGVAEDCIVDSDDLDKGWNIASIPGGNIVVAPDETSVEGVISFDRSTPYMGRWVDGIRWEFRNGQLVKYSAKASAESFSSIYEKADGDKNRLGRIGIGANPKIRRGFLQDSMSSGAITIWLGNNQDFGGTNKTGFMFPGVLGNATMSIDGHVIVEKGKLHRDMTP